MWQRIQTIFLLTASGSCWALFLKPMNLAGASGALASVQDTALSDGVLHLLENPVLTGVGALTGLISLVALMLFKNRPLQIRLTQVAIVMCVALMGVIAGYFYTDFTKIQGGGVVFQPGMLMPFLSLAGCVLALIFIRKDEKLVRSMDRLR